MINKWTHILSRIFFGAACVFSIIYVLDRALFFYGWDLLWIPFSANRLLDLVVIALIFVITLLLRQIREELKKQSAKP